MPRAKKSPGSLPSKAEILDYLKKAPGETARRDIARAFGVKGELRADLRRLLRELEGEGKLERSGKRIVQTETLGPVAAIDVMSIDDDGDLLCLPANWKGEAKPPMIRLSARRAAKLKPPPGVGDRLLARLKPAGDDGYDTDIIKAIGKSAHRFLAVFRKTKHGGFADPVERRARNNFTIERGDEGRAEDGDLVWVETKHARGYGPQRARVREIAGHISDRNAYSLIAIANHGAPIEFNAEAIAEAERAQLPPLGDRTDLRGVPLLTIDPEDAKDHDDAVWAAPDDDANNEGGFKVIVAIADVSWFVTPDSAMDDEARERGNSIYLPDRVVPMIPERLSNGLCSLREGEDRPCIAVEMALSRTGKKLRHRFMRAMMRSAAKLAYGDAQKIIEGKPLRREEGDPNASLSTAPGADVVETVKHLYAAYKARLEERKHRAPLDLDLPERKILLKEDGSVDRVIVRERFDAHKLIEEFMILANVAAAETLEQKKTPQIYRVHDAPDPEKLDPLREYLQELGYSLIEGPSVRPQHFNQILRRAEAADEKEMISEVVLRSQKQAVYATENLGHFGLNLPRYSHFTSPIRRYADLTVHRALVSALKLGAGGQTEKERASLSRTAEKISDFERRAMAVERESKDRYLAGYLAARVGAEFEGRIRGVTRFGLFVMLDETGADGFVPMRSLGADREGGQIINRAHSRAERFRFVEERHCVIGEASGGVYRLGQPVRVSLAEATPLTGGLRFEMISDPIPDAGGPKRKATKKTKRAPREKTGRGRGRKDRGGGKRRKAR